MQGDNELMIELDITNKEYRDRPAISSSDVKAAAKSLAHWKGAERKETTAFDIGTAFHELCLEPHKESIICGPENRLGKRWKEAKEEADAAGKLLLTSVDYYKAKAMSEAALSNQKLFDLIYADDALIEASIFVQDPETGLQLKTRPDCYLKSKKVCLDLKSTVDAGPGDRDFPAQLWKYKYDLQAAFYRHCCQLAGLPVAYFCFAATEKVSPYATCLHMVDEEVLQFAHEKMMNILRRIAKAEKEGVYSTDWPEINIIRLPEWMKHDDKE